MERALNQLGEIRQPPRGRTDRDEARVRRECVEILADLPLDVSGPAAKDALERTITEARREIEQRQAEKEQQAKKAGLVDQGVAEVLELHGRAAA